MLVDMRQQVQGELVSRGFVQPAQLGYHNRNNGRTHVVLACITAGLYPHAAQRIARECVRLCAPCL